MNSARPPALLISSIAAAPSFSLTSPPYTIAPAPANCFAVARPIPDAQPVTTTRFPERLVASAQLNSTASPMLRFLRYARYVHYARYVPYARYARIHDAQTSYAQDRAALRSRNAAMRTWVW